jgi:hypothetical protein
MDGPRVIQGDHGFAIHEEMEPWFHRLTPEERLLWLEEQQRLFGAANPNYRPQHDFGPSRSARILRLPQG